jgi:hypothetical protein
VKRKTSQSAIETHNLSSRQFPMPGTDLGTTNAIPFNDAYDVDMSGGRQSEYCLGTGDRDSNFSRVVAGREESLKPAKNPTRFKRSE